MMSPQGVRHDATSFGFDNAKAWQGMSSPCLFLSGTLDKTDWTNANDREIAFFSCPATNKFMAVINGAGHMTFAGVGNEIFTGAAVRNKRYEAVHNKIQQPSEAS